MGDRGYARLGGRHAGPAAKQPGHLRTDRNAADDYPHSNASYRNLMQVDYPFHFDSRGRTAGADEEDHIRDLIEQVLFTNPGERVNRPTFGSGLLQLVFAPNSDALAAATQMSVQGALQQWLGDLISVEEVQVTNRDSTLEIQVKYMIRRSQDRRVAQFQRTI
jgi:phage baseplate assembly protein W